MKRKIYFLSFLLIIFLTAGLSGRELYAKTYTVKVSSLKKRGKKVDWHRYLPSKYRNVYRIKQGCTTDGKKIYMLFKSKTGYGAVMMRINAKTLVREKVSAPFPYASGNDITYNPDTGLLYLAYNMKYPFRITKINPNTLKPCGIVNVRLPRIVTTTLSGRSLPGSSRQKKGSAKKIIRRLSWDLPGMTLARRMKISGIAGITYNSRTHQYALRMRRQHDILITDESFKPVRYIHIAKTSRLRHQSIDSDEENIYECLDHKRYYNIIMVYNWEGKYLYTVKIPLKYEAEGLYHIGNKTYLSFYYGRNVNNKFVRSSYTYRLFMP